MDEPKSLREIRRQMWKGKPIGQRLIGLLGRSAAARRIDIEASGIFTGDVIQVLSAICDALEVQGGSVAGLCSGVEAIRPKTWGGKALIDCVLYVSGAGPEPKGKWERLPSWRFDREERVCFELARGCVERKKEALPCVVGPDVCGAVADVLNQMVESGRVIWPPERELLDEAVSKSSASNKSRSL